MLLIDERAHGESEGTYIGFGTMDRLDGMEWVKWMIDKIGDDAQILLHGNSMGGATVCMMSGLKLPDQVKGLYPTVRSLRRKMCLPMCFTVCIISRHSP